MSIDFEAAGDGIYVVTINRPERMNALDVSSKHALAEIWRGAEDTDDVRAIVMRGAGDRAFCAGSDIKEIRATGMMIGTEALADAIPGLGIPLTKPIVAALHGFSIGMGLTLAIHCDIRIAAPTTRCGFPETQHGMLSGISAITLPAIVGEAAALEMMLTGRLFGADEALRLGLVHRIAEDPFAEAMATAQLLAANSSIAVRMTKRLILAERKRRVQAHFALVEESRDGVTRSPEFNAVVAGTPGTGRART